VSSRGGKKKIAYDIILMAVICIKQVVIHSTLYVLLYKHEEFASAHLYDRLFMQHLIVSLI
jgi:hypothetical protein